MTTAPKMSRFRRFTAGTAAAAALASGLAFAFFVDGESYAGNTATSASIVLETSLDSPLSFSDMYPTSNPEPGTGQEQAFTISNNNDVDVSYVLSADDASTTPEGQTQFNQLYVRIVGADSNAGSPFDAITGGGDGPTVYYEGLLSDLFTDQAIVLDANSGENGFTMELFLLETGTEQAQNATTTFTINVDAQTTPIDRAAELDA